MERRVSVDVPARRWPNAKVALVAYLLGQGYNSTVIAKKLDDDTSPAVVRQMGRYWGLTGGPTGKRGSTALSIRLDARVRAKLERQAGDIGIPPDEFVRRIAVCAINDQMYQAITDGAFE